MSTTLEIFIEKARAQEKSEGFIEAASEYIEQLQRKGYPVFFSLVHFAIAIKMPTRLVQYIIENKNADYTYFKMPKKKGGYREIMAPREKLKFIQSWILFNILNKYPLTEQCHSFRKGFSIITNAKVHAKAKYILKIDLLKFYDTITEKRVYGTFKAMGYLPNLAWDLAKLTTARHRDIYWDNIDSSEERKLLGQLLVERPPILPQGAPSSPMLSNIIADRLDKRLGKLGEKRDYNYSRYADDLTFSANSFTNLPHLSIINKIVESEGFFVNQKKVSYSKKGMKQFVTGLTITHGVHVSKKYRRNIFTHLHYASKFGPNEHLKRRAKKEKTVIKRQQYAYMDWLFGSIAFVYAVDKKNGKKMMDKFNKIDWTFDTKVVSN